MTVYSIFPLGDQAVTLSFGNEINESDHHRVLHVEQVLKSKKMPGVKDIIIAYSSLTICYDAVTVINFSKSQSAFIFWKELLEEVLKQVETSSRLLPDPIRIPVCYDGDYAPDMEYVCKTLALNKDELVRIHTNVLYTVYMIGFLPGFPYMGTVDNRLRIGRKDAPREKIAAGSVGLAGIQTGIYPMESPGGWQIIGCTPVSLFDKFAAIPSLLSPGDRVEFFSISKDQFINHGHTYP